MKRYILILILSVSIPAIAMEPAQDDEPTVVTAFKFDCSLCQGLGEKVAKQAIALKECADNAGITGQIVNTKNGLCAKWDQLKQLASALLDDDDEKAAAQQNFTPDDDADNNGGRAALKEQIAQLEAQLADLQAIINVLIDNVPQESPTPSQ